MFLPPGETSSAVFFHRNGVYLGGVGTVKNVCTPSDDRNTRYNFSCLSESRYTLTIPREIMTELEQNSTWKCSDAIKSSYKSNDAVLTIASKCISNYCS